MSLSRDGCPDTLLEVGQEVVVRDLRLLHPPIVNRSVAARRTANVRLVIVPGLLSAGLRLTSFSLRIQPLTLTRSGRLCGPAPLGSVVQRFELVDEPV